MVIAWFVGVYALSAGFTAASVLHKGLAPDIATARTAAYGGGLQELEALWIAAERTALFARRDLYFPLAATQAALGGLLVIASGLAMSGRPGSRSFALQALGANVALAVARYVLSRDVRGACIDEMLRVASTLPADMPLRRALESREALWWRERVSLAIFDLGTLGLGAIALTRERAKLYFEAAARAAESTEEEP